MSRGEAPLRRWGFRAGCGIVPAMQTRRSAGRSRGWGCVVAVAVAIGCSDEPRRFTVDAAFGPGDLGGLRDVAADRGDTGGLDAGPDAGVDAGRDAAFDAALDAADARRDVAVESSVLGCVTNADCPSPDLYCNGPGCRAMGFCVPRRAASACAMVDAAAADLVCGCDGMTYSSLCQLQVEGVRLVGFGLCPRD